MTAPIPVRLQHVPIDYRIPWQVFAQDGTYLAGLPTKEAALAYMRLKGMKQVGD